MQTNTQTSETSDMVVMADSAPKLVLVKSEMAGDKMRDEKETPYSHWRYCAGCEICWPESLERESDI